MTYSLDLRKRVVDYVHQGGKKVDAAHLFGVSTWCVNDWCTRDDLAPKPQSRRKRKLDWGALERHTQDFPDAYLRERAEHFGVHIHAIEYALNQMKITRKKSLLYQERDHEQRIQYLQTVRNIVKAQGSDSLVYFDESAFESSTYRPHAYAKRGQKIHGNRSGKRGERTNLILAKQGGKLLSPMLFTGSANMAFVNEWVEQCLLKEVRSQSTIILDNARFHNKSDLERILRKHDHHLLFLPPYSPDFNPIEKTFAHIKRYRQSQPDNTSIEAIIREYGNYLE